MMLRKELYPIAKYDAVHDVMHVYLGSMNSSFADEEAPGVYVFRNEDTDCISGYKIMDYRTAKKDLQKNFPAILESIKESAR